MEVDDVSKKTSVPSEVEDINVNVFKMIASICRTKLLMKHI